MTLILNLNTIYFLKVLIGLFWSKYLLFVKYSIAMLPSIGGCLLELVVCCEIHVLYFITCSLLLLISTSLVLQKCQVVLEIFNAQDLVLIHGLCWKDLNGRNAVHVHVHVLIRSSGATTKQSVFSNCRWPDPISSNAPVWRPLVEFLLLLWYKHRLNSCIYALQTLSQIQTFNFNLWSLTKILELSL